MFDILSSIISPFRPYKSFKAEIKRGFVYHKSYEKLENMSVIPGKKYFQLKERLVKSDWVKDIPIFEIDRKPEREELLLFHTPDYLDDFFELNLTDNIMSSEIPLTYEIINFFLYSTRGTYLALEMAYKSGGIFANLSGGFHHAFCCHAEGFCYLNDVGYAIENFQKNYGKKNILVIDLDIHQGNGICYCYGKRTDVYVFNIYQEDNYPKKEEAHLNIGLPSGTDGKEYLAKLADALDIISREFQADLGIYLAGADPYEHDVLGGFLLSKEELITRDQMVKLYFGERNIPYVIVLAGGYAMRESDVIDIHYNTLKVSLTGNG